MALNGIVVKKSSIHGKGVFAARDFRKGEIVLKWKGKILLGAEKNSLSSNQQKFCSKYGKGKWILFDAPCKYVNHSCKPNTKAQNRADVAIRNITKDEEITTDYKAEGASVDFECNCECKLS